MKITAAQQNLAASHLEIEQREVSERLRTWIGDRPAAKPAAAKPDGAAEVALSSLARSLSAFEQRLPVLQSTASSNLPNATDAPESSAIAEAMKGAEGDPVVAMLRSMLERVFGIHIKVFDPSELNPDAKTQENLQKIPGNATSGPGWGVEYERHEQRSEMETTSFAAEGVVHTADGREIRFQLSLEMTRSYSERIDLAFSAGSAARKKDPLVVNFGGAAAQLADVRFEIDLDRDGRNETARFAAPGSGFLVFDKNADGKINDGGEMFGPTTGDGFAELATHDSDGNGWIDENDPIFGQLRVWTKSANGGDHFATLKEANVGAISLARLATPFAIRDGDNNALGDVRSTGVYLTEDGQAGTVQQVDLAV